MTGPHYCGPPFQLNIIHPKIRYCWLHLEVPNIQMSCSDSTKWQSTRLVVPVMTTRATCPISWSAISSLCLPRILLLILSISIHISWSLSIFLSCPMGPQGDISCDAFNSSPSGQMAAISQTTLSNTFSWLKMLEFWLKFHWSLFLRVKLTIFQHWFR